MDHCGGGSCAGVCNLDFVGGDDFECADAELGTVVYAHGVAAVDQTHELCGASPHRKRVRRKDADLQ